MPACAYIQWLCDGCSAVLMLRQDTGFPLGWVHVDISATGGRQAKLMLCEMCIVFRPIVITRFGNVIT